MRKILLLVLISIGFWNVSLGCDRTSVSLVSSYQNSTTGENFYTVQVCLGLSPNWGSTDGFTLNGDVNITSTTTSSITSNYNYCSVAIAFNGAGCAVSSMGQPPAGGTVQSTSVNASANLGGGNLSYTGGSCDGCWLAPDDLRGDCADCNNSNSVCFQISFSTSTSTLSTLTLEGTEDGQCPDETISLASPPVCTPPEIIAEVNGSTSVTVCEGDAIDLGYSACTGCSGGGKSYTWSGPDGYSSTSQDPNSFNATASSGGTYSVYAADGACVGPATSVSVNVDALPTGTMGQSDLSDCSSVDVPVSFTGDSPWTFTYEVDGSPTTVTTSDNPYYIPVSSTSTVTFGSGVTNATCAGSGSTSGSTNVDISAVNSDAGSDFSPDPSTNYTIDATATSGLDGYDTTTTLKSNNSSEGVTFLNNDPSGVDATDISIGSLGLTCTNLTISNIPDNAVCFTYTDSKASNIQATLCFGGGGNCITVAAGGVSGSPFCFDKSDVLNILDGQSCSTGSFSLNVADVVDGNGPNGKDGILDDWTVSLNDIATTLRPNPSYSWTAVSGGADTNFLSATNIEDPVFNAPAGTAAGCYELTVTDGQGCTSIDQVCFAALALTLDLVEFNTVVQDHHVKLNWEPIKFDDKEKYFVERSYNGVDFEQISNMVEPFEDFRYEYLDDNPLNIGYYRLKRIDANGFTDYSDIRKVMLTSEETLEIVNIYPQPLSGDQMHLVLNSGKEQEVILKMYDITGKIVKQESMDLKQGVLTYTADMTNVESGILSLVVSSRHNSISTKVHKR